MKKLIRSIKKMVDRIYFFTARCRYCGGKLKYDFYDAEFDCNVYKCEKCHARFI